MEPEAIGTIIGGAAVVLHIGGTWFREYRKHRTWRANGKDLKEIKQDVKSVKLKQGEQGEAMAKIGQSLEDQKTHCQTTVNRITRGMSDFNKELLAQAKTKSK